MRIPDLTWDRRHNVARLLVSFGERVWHRRTVGEDLILGYNAAGRLFRIVVLDPRRLLPDVDCPRAALVALRPHLEGRVRPEDLAVVLSAIERA